MDDIHGLKPFMLFTPDLRYLALFALALVAAWLVARWWLRRRRRPAPVALPAPVPAPTPVPARSALRQLDDLAARQLPAAGRTREFHVALSGVVRAYLGARFAIPARRMTTTELLGALGARQLDDRTARRLADLLPGCDLAKFADVRPSGAEMDARLATAREVVEALGDLAVPAEDEDATPRAGQGVAS